MDGLFCFLQIKWEIFLSPRKSHKNPSDLFFDFVQPTNPPRL